MAIRSTCSACGASASSEARYCDHCGSPLNHAATPARRRHQPRRMAAWLFVLVLLLLYAGGTVGGYRYQAGRWPGQARPTLAIPKPEVSIAPPPARATPDHTAAVGYLKSVVAIQVKGAQGTTTGSGFIIGNQGHVVTVAHVVNQVGECVEVIDDYGKPHQGRVLGRDAAQDIAMIEVPTLRPWPFRLELGRSSELNTFDPLYVMSSPKGSSHAALAPAEFSRTLLDQRIGNAYFKELLQISGAQVLQGSSGGPLVNRLTGTVVGVVTVGSSAQLAYAIPVDLIAGQLERWAALPSLGACPAQRTGRTISLTLAAMTPLSGLHGTWGADLADGAELALRDLEAELRRVGYEVTIKRADDQSSPAVAGELARTLSFDPQVIGVIGSLDSPTTASIAAAVADDGLPMVAPTAGADELTRQNWHHLNRLVANSRRHEQAAARFFQDRLQATRIFMLEDGTDYAGERLKSFEAAAQVLSLSLVGREVISPLTDYVALKQRLLETQADGIYYAGAGEAALQAIQALRKGQVLLPVVGGETLYDSRFGTLPAEHSQKVYFTLLTTGSNEPFRRHFESVFGKPPRGFAPYGYDAARLILEALLVYGEANPGKAPSRSELAALVRSTKGFPGWTAFVTFDEVGENRTSRIHVYEWRSDRAEIRESIE